MSDKRVIGEPGRSADMQASLTQRGLTGFLWVFSGTAGQAVLQLIVVMVLARLLTPEDFGLVGAAMVVIAFSQIFCRIGIGPAVIQRPDLQADHIHAGFFFSVLFGILVSGLVYSLSPWIAGFFRMDGLAQVIKVLSIVFPITGLSIVAQALLQRKMEFKKLAGVEISSYALGYGTIGIVLAATGWGVWSLVAAQLGQSTLKTIGMLLVNRHSIGFPRNMNALKQLLNFSAGFSLGRIGNFAANQGDNLVAGRWLGAEALGIYALAYRFTVLPANLFGSVVDRVMFPMMAIVQDDKERLARAYKKAVGSVAMVTLPLSILLVILAPEIVHVLLGQKWEAVVLPFQILAATLLFRTSYKLSDSLARATGAVYRRAWRQWIYAGAVFAGAFVGHFWGVAGIATGVAGAIIINFTLMLHLSLKLTDLGLAKLARQHFRHLTIALILGSCSGLTVYGGRWLGLSEVILLLSAIMATFGGIVVLLAINRNTFGEEGEWAWSLISGRFKRSADRLSHPGVEWK
jgi:O-antigen/teichoic acid export membrane protein